MAEQDHERKRYLLMNYLAHAYLSFEQEDVLTGNMISDYVKGKQQFNYSPGIQKGIVLHRAIDHFTDTHPIVKEAKKIFQSVYRLYSGAFIDIVFDHFLAKKLDAEIPLKAYTEKIYLLLEKNTTVFPERFGAMFPYMRKQDWLFNYQFNEGIEKSFGGLQRRAKYIAEVQTAYALFLIHYNDLQVYFTSFWKELFFFTKNKYNSLTIG